MIAPRADYADHADSDWRHQALENLRREWTRNPRLGTFRYRVAAALIAAHRRVCRPWLVVPIELAAWGCWLAALWVVWMHVCS